MVGPMLDELLDREGLDGDEVLTWAQARAEQLLAELVESDELVRLLEPAAQIDIDAISVRRVEDVDDMLPVAVGVAAVEDEVEESITSPITLPPIQEDLAEPEVEGGGRGRRRVPSNPQPLSASELPPPPEQLSDGEPEPILETFDTGPIDLGTAEARAMIVATSTRAPIIVEPEPEPVRQEITQVAPAPTAPPPVEAEASVDGTEEFEIDELEEIDDEELELLEEEDAGDDDDSDAAPAPPPRPPAKPGAPRPPADSEASSSDSDSFDIDVD
jgi:hypothetical protein